MDNRRDQRRRIFKGGKIVFDWGRSSIDCTIRDLSASGAALTVENTIGIPAEFTLIIMRDNVAKACRVVWKEEKRVGVTFVQA